MSQINHFIFALFLGTLLLLFTACNQHAAQSTDATPQFLEARLDSMEQKLRKTYSPGFGELMLNIQIHHAKLWFAGKNGNWELAAYDQSLIRSAIQKIRTYHPDNANTAALAMIDIPMDSLTVAIAHKNAGAFQRGFLFLTTTCNNCHVATKHAFNIITIPGTEPIGNQSFTLNSTNK